MNDYLDNDRPAWEILQDESTLWFGRFQVYLNLGPGRTINDASINAIGEAASVSWYNAARDFRWRDRAAAYDNFIARNRRIEIESMRWKAKQDRIALLNNTYSKLAQSVEFLEPEMIQWTTFAQMLRVFMEASHREFEAEKIDLSVNDGTNQATEGEMIDARDRLLTAIVAIIESRGSGNSDKSPDTDGMFEGTLQLGQLVEEVTENPDW